MQQNDFVYDHILIRYGELSTKGKNRKDFIRRLYTNVKHALNMFEAIEIEKTHDRMYIHLNETDPFEIKPYLEKIFGISSFSFAVRVDSDIEKLVSRTLHQHGTGKRWLEARPELVTDFVTASDGLFIFARTAVEFVLGDPGDSMLELQERYDELMEGDGARAGIART